MTEGDTRKRFPRKRILAVAWKYLARNPMNLFYPIWHWKYFLSGIYLFNGNKIFKHRSARIEQRNGRILFGAFQHPFKFPRGFIRLEANAKLIITGDVAIGDGTWIEIGPGATLEIGGNTVLNMNTRIGVKESIRIGRDCAISAEVGIFDTDMHVILIGRSKLSATAPIEIGDHVWIGAHSAILKGTRIESGAVIGATALVQGRIPAKSVVLPNRSRVNPLNIEWVLE